MAKSLYSKLNEDMKTCHDTHGMSVEFLWWFQKNKLPTCGDMWFVACSAMWEGWKAAKEQNTKGQSYSMNMFAICYIPTGVPVGLYVNEDAAIKRCRYLSESKDFGIFNVDVSILTQVKENEEKEA